MQLILLAKMRLRLVQQTLARSRQQLESEEVQPDMAMLHSGKFGYFSLFFASGPHYCLDISV